MEEPEYRPPSTGDIRMRTTDTPTERSRTDQNKQVNTTGEGSI